MNSMLIILTILSLIAGFVLGFRLACLRKTAGASKEAGEPMPSDDKKDGHVFSSEEKAAPLDSGVLEKKILYDQELNSLLKIGHDLSGSVKLKDVCKIIIENVRKALSVERAALLLLDKNTDRLRVAYSFGLKPEEYQATDIKKGESISGWVASNNEMLVIKNIDDDYWLKTNNQEKYYTKSLVSSPLSLKNMVFGVLNVNNKHSAEQFNEDDLRLLKGIASQGAVAIQNAKLYEELEDSYLRVIMALAAALDAKDHYTHKHSENVTRYAVAIAQAIRLSDIEIETIRRCGMLHDIGKIGIRDGILSSPRKLTEEEYEQIKKHSAKGEEIISALPFLKDVAVYVRQHHERFDGKGYPDGKMGHQIELPARIMAVCDAFDAMTSDRPYRNALVLQEACEELKRNRGTQFDAEIVDAFLKILENNPGIMTQA